MSAAPDRDGVVRLVRRIAAPPARVYRAWLDPRLLERWLAPGRWTVVDVAVDERVGGRFHVIQRDADGRRGGFLGELVELVPSRRIVYRWGFAGPDGRDGPVYDSRLTISLRAVPDGATELTLVHERLGALAAALPAVAERVPDGWASVLAKLERLLARGG